ncbi:hypothetical protein PPERSA_02925 [Pseudocohnilembus persalinus]|uniref:Cilia- and flagella-associated protein 157 n=1 Tax=Pseudocohnilembus persalinus TaxID=266149 RepID=A0A0V0R765_PSEPJ|nr:hypothetical protein PPERSA_02925 [Pseudocohnilembus persalinus]|eukprot:KRX10186.1 hypothetical protein PPERSA_02925 [Pseudocohnilembus persalinus]
MHKKDLEFNGERSDLEDKKKMLEAKIENIDTFMKQQEHLRNAKNMMQGNLENEILSKQRELEIKNQEKVEATDKLKKEMLHKIQETKTSLLALKKEQLQTTIRLTVLQNHQLTTELEYQSKQTEKLLFKNQKLQEEIQILKRDVEIHKQVEQELAKRSHFCQKLIKKLKARMEELMEESEQIEQEKQEQIQLLEKKPQEEYEKEQIECDLVKNENGYLQQRTEKTEVKFTNLAILIQELLDAESEKYNQAQLELNQDYVEDNNFMIDLNQVKDDFIQQWTPIQRIALMTIIMNQAVQLIQSRDFVKQFNETQKNTKIEILEEKQKLDLSFPSKKIKKFIKKLKLLIFEGIGSDQQSQRSRSRYEQNQQGSQYQSQNQSLLNNHKRFKDIPIDISTKIVKADLRQWGKISQTMPTTNAKSLTRRFKQ